jgi:hypothetical protein
MDEKTRQLVLDLLRQAQEGALKAVQPALDELPSDGRKPVMESITALVFTIDEQARGNLQPLAAEARMASLIHGHASPQVVDVLEHFAGALLNLLFESRKQLVAPGQRRDH